MSARRAVTTIGGIAQAFADRGISLSADTIRRLIRRETDPLPAGQLGLGSSAHYVCFVDDLDEWLDRQLARSSQRSEVAQ